MNQVYLIKQESNSNPNRSKFHKSVFSNYAESRRIAMKMVNRFNSIYNRQINISDENDHTIEIAEIAPDLWSNGNMTISIIAMLTQN